MLSILLAAAVAVTSAFQLSSPAFKSGDAIPAKYTCDGLNISPPLQWEDVPQNTQSIAIVVDDPDAPSGLWTHWILYNLAPSMRSLQERVSKDFKLPDGSMQAENDYGKPGYGGPCPPSGTHHYIFHAYALDKKLTLPEAAKRKAFDRAIEGHVLAKSELTAAYKRQEKS